MRDEGPIATPAGALPTSTASVTIGRCAACGQPLIAPRCSECGTSATNERWLGLGVDPAGAALLARRLRPASIATRIGLFACLGPLVVGLLLLLAALLMPSREEELSAVAAVVGFWGTGLLLPLQLAWPVQLACLGRALRSAESLSGEAGGSWHGPAARLAGFAGLVLLVPGAVVGRSFFAPVFLLTIATLPLMLDAFLRRLRQPPLGAALGSSRLIRAARLLAHLGWLAIGVAGLGVLGAAVVLGPESATAFGVVALLGAIAIVPIELLGLLAIGAARRELRR